MTHPPLSPSNEIMYTLYLRNLVLVYECGRIFPASVGPDSPHPQEMRPTGCLRDSVGRSRRVGGMVEWRYCSPGAPLPSSNLVLFGRRWHARDREHCHVAESLVGHKTALHQVSTHQIRRRRRAVRSSTSQGSAESLRARIKGAEPGGF